MTIIARPRMRMNLFLILVFLSLSGIPKVYGQLENGAIQGSVTDQTGAVIPNLRVTLTNEGTALTVSTLTGTGGVYVFTPIKIGTYTVAAEFQGFEKQIRPHITVDVQQQVVVDFTLHPGSVTQSVEVTAAPPLLQTQDSSVGQVIGGREINDLPLNGRNFTFLAQLSAGANQAQQDGRGYVANGGFSANGVREESNNYLLDGIDNNNDSVDFLNGTFYVALPPPDALAEFKVETANYNAEFGRTGGAVLNATIKSGTNQFHGDAWEFIRNDKLDAADFFTNATGQQTGRFLQNQFGLTAGGPIKRNKTFVFGDYQGTRIRQGLNYVETVPTATMRSSGYTDFSDLFSQSTATVSDDLGRTFPWGAILDPATTRTVTAGVTDPVTGLTANTTGIVRDAFPGNLIPVDRIDQNAVKLLNLLPQPNLPGLYNNFADSPIQSLNTDSFDVRVDQNFSARDQMFARVSYTRSPGFIPGPFPGLADGGNYNQNDIMVGTRNAALSETHSFNPTMVNSFRYSFARVHTLFSNLFENQMGIPEQYGIQGIPQVAKNGGLPNFSVGGITEFGQSWVSPVEEWDDTSEVADSLTKVYNLHTIKAGFEGLFLRPSTFQPPAPRGAYDFSGMYTSVPGLGAVFGNPNSSGAVQFVLTPTTASVPGGIDYVGGPDYVEISRLATTIAMRKDLAGYVQDDWKVRRNLTLNYGVRWEYFPPIYEKHDGQANFIAGTPFSTAAFLIPQSRSDQSNPNNTLSPSFTSLLQEDGVKLQYVSNRGLYNAQTGNFAPRIGFAYHPTTKLVVRAGYAISYNGAEGQGYGPALGQAYPFAFSLTYSAPSSATPITFASGQNAAFESTFANIAAVPANVPGSGVTLFGIEKNLKTAYVQSTNFTLQYQLSPNTSVQAAYVGTSGRHLQESVNDANPVHELLTPTTDYLPYDQFPDLASWGLIQHGEGSMYYNGLQLNLERKFGNGVSFLGNYTWSKCRSDGIDNFNPTAINYRAPDIAGISIDYGPCDADIRQVFHFSGGYELPFGKGKRFLTGSHGLANQIIGGWRTNWILTLQDGQPFNIPCDIGAAADAGCDALMVPGQNRIGGQHNVNQWMNPAAFTNPSVVAVNGQTDLAPLGGTPGQVAGPGFHRLDFSLFKEFRTTEKTHLEFRAEVFNLTNHPNFALPGGLDFASSNFGQITGTRDSPNDPRIMQFALKFYW